MSKLKTALLCAAASSMVLTAPVHAQQEPAQDAETEPSGSASATAETTDEFDLDDWLAEGNEAAADAAARSAERESTGNADADAFAALMDEDEVVSEADLEAERAETARLAALAEAEKAETAAERAETAQNEKELTDAQQIRDGLREILQSTDSEIETQQIEPASLLAVGRDDQATPSSRFAALAAERAAAREVETARLAALASAAETDASSAEADASSAEAELAQTKEALAAARILEAKMEAALESPND